MDKNIYVDKDYLSEELDKKADSSHGTHLTLGTGSGNAYRGDYGNTAYNHSQSTHAPSNAQKNSDITKAEIEAKLTGNISSHTHSYAGSSSAGGAANSVKANMSIKLNGGGTEGTDLFTYNGSTAKTVNITPSGIGAASSTHTHSAADMNSGTISADRFPSSGVTAGNYGPNSNSAPGYNGTFTVPYITVDAKGRITAASSKTITLPSGGATDTDTKVTNTLGTTTKFYLTGTTSSSTNTGTQYFDTGIYSTNTAGQLQVTGGLITGGNIVSDTAVTDSLGSSTVPWSYLYSKNYSLRGNATGTSYGALHVPTVGTTSATGETRLTLGNGNTTGKADNAFGKLLMYGTNTGYTAITPGNNTTNNIAITLPSDAGTLALTSHTHNYAGSSSAGGAATSALTCTGNSATATKFASAQSVTLTGDVTGSASSQAGWTVATTLAKSGVTAGNYGPSANASPGNSGTFSVPYITVDAKGRVTAASTKTITLPAGTTDTKVTNTLNTTTKFFLAGTTGTSTNTGTQIFDTGIYSTTTAGQLQVTGGLISGGVVRSDTAVTDDLGTSAIPWRDIYSRMNYFRRGASASYGYVGANTTGTADATGEARLQLGNNIAKGTADNAYGRILLYGTSSGYTLITPGNNSTGNVTITLPSAGGNLPLMTKGDTSYWGFLTPEGGTNWIRTPNSGLIPAVQDATNGSGGIGTASWPFASVYAMTINEGGTKLSEKYAAKSHGTHVSWSTTTPKANGTASVGSETKVARGDHVHPLQTTVSGNAGSADKVNKSLTIKLNGGSTEGTNLFTFNGSAAKSINITPDSIGAAASTHGTHVSYGGNGSATTVSRSDHTHNYAGSSSAGGAATSANKVNKNLVIKLNSGSTEGTDLFTFNGSAAKSINITPSSIGAAASSHGTHLTIGTGSGNAAAGNHTHTYYSRSSVGDIGYETAANRTLPTTVNAIAFWNGAYQGTSSNLAYCSKGAFGSIVTKNSGDYLGASATAAAATKLATARNFKIGATSKSFNGTGDVSWSLGEIMKGQGLTAANACGTLYFNNAGTSHVGRLSMYNNADGDYTQLACYRTSDSATANYITIYPNHISFGSYVIARGYIRPYNNGSLDLGASEYRWRTVYSANGVNTTSDRTIKENIKYVRTGETEIDYNDMYNFVKDDLELATYNYINSEEKHVNFVAQDLLANEDGTDNKVGQFIVNPVPVPAEEEIENGKPYPLLSYNTNIYTSVLAGALKKSINEIEDLKAENKELKEMLYNLISRVEELENK